MSFDQPKQGNWSYMGKSRIARLTVLALVLSFLGYGIALAAPRNNGSGTCWQSGASWSGNSASYWTNNSTIPTGWRTAISSAANTWTNVSTSAFTLSNTDPFQPSNGNDVRVGTIDNAYVALTSVYASPTLITKTILTFSNNKTFATNGSIGAYDVQDIATHEFGHWVFLADQGSSSCSASTMKTPVYYGETFRRSLDTSDINGVSWQYP